MSEDVAHESRGAEQAADSQGFSVVELLIILARHKRIVVGIPFVVAIVTAVISLLMAPIYTGITKILPPQNQSAATAALLGQLGSQFGGIAGLAGNALGLKNPNDLYVGMLKSRTVADNLIAQFELHKLYGVKYLDEARKVLAKNTTITSGRDNIIAIEVEDKDSKRAAAMANAYVNELYKLTQTVAVTEASQRRLFFERELGQARTKLTEAEVTARQKLEKGGLVVLDAQGKAMVETTARLRGLISVKEIQISAMRSFAADRNPELLQAQQELDAMKQELAKTEGAADGKGGTGPEAKPEGMDNMRLLRNVRYYETMYDVLAKQYELARLEEARDAPLIQALDKAIEPERKTRPKRTLMVILATLVSGFLSIFLAFFKEALDNMKAAPGQMQRLTMLFQLLRNWRQ